MTKECSKCGSKKSETEFYRDSSKDDGFTNDCKECRRAYVREWSKVKGIRKSPGWVRKTADMVEYRKKYRLENPEKMREYEEKHKRTPEQEKEKRARKMIRLHGPDWKPKERRVFKTDEERAQAKRDKSAKRRMKQKTDPQARRKT